MPFTVIYRAKIVSCPSHFTLDHTKWSVFIIWQWLVLDISSTNDKWQILGILSSSKPSSNIHLKWDKSLINIQCETSTLFIFFFPEDFQGMYVVQMPLILNLFPYCIITSHCFSDWFSLLPTFSSLFPFSKEIN